MIDDHARMLPSRPTRRTKALTGVAGAFTAALLASGMAAEPAQAAAPMSCASLASATIANTTITQATSVAAGTTIGGTTVSTAICRVVGVVSTKPGEQVGIEVWLPTTDWNGRLEGVGNGGFGGVIVYSALEAGVARGFATANTDTGHTGGTSGQIGQPLPWVENKVSLKDWGHTSIHLMTVAAKKIIHDFYGKTAKYAYYDGCSTGGAEGMEEAEFYPDDYDGIHAGSPGQDYSHLMMSFLWGGLLPAENPAATLTTAALTLLNTAVLQQCEGSQAVQDGFLLHPRACHYDPAQLLCQSGQDPSTCLTAPQVQEAERLYSAVRDPVTGLKLYPGFVRGSESQWALIQGLLVGAYAQPLLANAVFDNPNWDWTTFNFDSDAFLVDKKLSPYINAINPDLHPLKSHGKLIVTQGWADALNAQTLPIEYYDSVVLDQGSLGATESFYRLFMVPGMSHCGGGPGPNTVGGSTPPTEITAQRDVLTALQAWVEDGIAPAKFIATKYVGDKPANGILLERPLCPYPEVIRYRGGDTSQASSYECASDENGFAADITQEQKNVLTDALIGDLQNLPN
ncbi:MAG: tannase/feruloyl esterase family alpha/beta hydrolase [Acidisphaera sp.]|nr:tannase/feruloyl esterase family alpha/beta hydrolase [Acidisphaera sp.]